ncbi:MAG: hypothetical protein Q9195_005754 [Heterodermia aff. obscurata]
MPRVLSNAVKFAKWNVPDEAFKILARYKNAALDSFQQLLLISIKAPFNFQNNKCTSENLSYLVDMAIEKGNTFYVPGDYLGGASGQKVTIKWSQSLRNRTEEYWVGKYTNKSANSSEENLIFVQASKLDELKNKKIDGDNVTLKVDDSFQYGQKKDGSKRFLVYHDKDNKPYQHRFVENTITELGGKAADFVSQLGYADVNKVEDVARNFLGDYLRNF